MSPELVGLLGVIFLLVLFLLRMPVAVSMLLAGFVGYSYLAGLDVGLTQLGVSIFGTIRSYNLSVIPLFILMGMFLSHSELGGDLYRAIDSWLGRLQGGMAIATLGACAIFSAISGSTTATAATMASVALPEMRKHGYKPSFAAACVAAGGTLGILIPPSVVLIFYGVLTKEPIGRLLIAGFVPGLLLTLFYMIALKLEVRRKPELAPQPVGNPASMAHKLALLRNTGPIVLLFILTMGGIYLGIFTPTEAGGVGAFGAFVFALVTRRLTWSRLIKALDEATRLTAMILFILVGATLFTKFLAITKIPMEMVSFVSQLQIPAFIVLLIVLVTYFLLGFFMDGLAIMVLTIPIVYPLIIELGFNGIWFGVILVLMLEIGLLTPPFGLNVYVVSGVARNISLESIFRAVVPFWIAIIACTALLVMFPQIVLFLPNYMR